MTIRNQPVNSDVIWGSLSFENSPMKSHIQGLFILLGVTIALLALANIAAPVLGDAFGENGAIVAESAADDGADPAAEEAIVVPLDGEEVALLQANLTDLGFDPGPVDGILGNGTRSAISEAIRATNSRKEMPGCGSAAAGPGAIGECMSGPGWAKGRQTGMATNGNCSNSI